MNIFITSFVGISLIYAILATFTKVFYKNKHCTELSCVEIKILNNEATIKDRLLMFITSLASGIIFPPAYIFAGIITLIYKIIS